MDASVSGIGVEAVEYDRESGTVRTRFARDRTPPSTTVVGTLADVMDAEPAELDPLESTIDTDALDAIVGAPGDVRVAFTHEGHAITVHSYGVVTITPGDGSTDADRVRGTER